MEHGAWHPDAAANACTVKYRRVRIGAKVLGPIFLTDEYYPIYLIGIGLWAATFAIADRRMFNTWFSELNAKQQDPD